MNKNETVQADEYTYLGQQAEDAKRAMIRTVGEIGTTTDNLIDLDGRMKRSPWLTLGVVVAAGFLVAELLPRRRIYVAPVEVQQSPAPNPILAAAFAPLADSITQVLAEVAPAIVAAIISPTAPPEDSEQPPADAPVNQG